MKAAVAGGDWSGTARDFDAFMGKDVSNSSLAQKPDGTGAYQFVARDPSRFVMKGFEGYWGGVPALKNVILQKVDSDTARVLALQKGDADIAIIPDRDTLAKLKGVSGVKVYEDLPTHDLTGVVLYNQNIKDDKLLPAGQLAENNIPVNFFSDIHVRKAFAALFDTKTFLRDALKGYGLARHTTLPTNNWAEVKTLNPPAYNLKTAEAEFKQAFGGKLWTTGFTVPLSIFPGSGVSEVVAGIFKQNVEALNPKFHANISNLELSAANASLLGGKLAFDSADLGRSRSRHQPARLVQLRRHPGAGHQHQRSQDGKDARSGPRRGGSGRPQTAVQGAAHLSQSADLRLPPAAAAGLRGHRFVLEGLRELQQDEFVQGAEQVSVRDPFHSLPAAPTSARRREKPVTLARPRRPFARLHCPVRGEPHDRRATKSSTELTAAFEQEAKRLLEE